MFIKKLTNTCVAVLMLGMGIFTGCSGDNSTTAGVYTETNSGKPAEYLCALSQLDTSLVKRSHNGSVSVCHTTKDIENIDPSLDSVVVDSSFDSDDEIESYVICGMSIAQTMLFINVSSRPAQATVTVVSSTTNGSSMAQRSRVLTSVSRSRTPEASELITCS